MHTVLKPMPYLLLLLSLGSLAACGGGGDANDSADKTTQPPACIERPELCK